MSNSLRASLLVLWASVVSLGFVDELLSDTPTLGRIVLPGAWIFLRPRAEFTRPISFKAEWPYMLLTAALLALLVCFGLSGMSKAFDSWMQDHPKASGFFCGALWFVYMLAAVDAYRRRKTREIVPA